MLSAFRNFTIGRKLLISYGIFALIVLIVGAIGFNGTFQLYEADKDMYENDLAPVESVAVMLDELANQRICLSNLVIYIDDDPKFAHEEGTACIEEKGPNFVAAMELFRQQTVIYPEAQAIYRDLVRIYDNDFYIAKNNVIAAVSQYESGAITYSDLIPLMETMDSTASDVSDYVAAAMELIEGYANAKVTANHKLYNEMIVFIIAIVAAAIVLVILISQFMTRITAKPLELIRVVMEQAADTGDLNFHGEQQRQLKANAKFRDEIGEVSADFLHLMYKIYANAQILHKISVGDLTSDVKPVTEDDELGQSLLRVNQELNLILADINAAANELNGATNGVSHTSTALAQSTSQQARILSELHDEIKRIAEQSNDNAEKAGEAADLGAQILTKAHTGQEQMQQMKIATDGIKEASNSIANVIEVIDNIAFQTNILALNAAVEAARAGSAGKGFAVVAEEVRSLAAKSAEAAKNTSSLIQNAIDKSAQGSEIAELTTKSFADIVVAVNRNAEIVGSIASGAAVQVEEITQIAKDVEEISTLVQGSSAVSEESAATATEISGLAASLHEQVLHFNLKDF
ncbi:MAG: methyl-accepting chemotaxis protein [Oscillospiraceae bacterium]|jgi:methyl-accepting chemotaxis protein|nr:methyl-accepting chemotaxis protein [Oscillospiraceae bacterium]